MPGEGTSLTEAVRQTAGISLTKAVKDAAGRGSFVLEEGFAELDRAHAFVHFVREH